jgi:Di-haem oxidoreductase, putative peroxidase
MNYIKNVTRALTILTFFWVVVLVLSSTVNAQLTDQTQTPNAGGFGIALSLEQQIGGGQGDISTPGTSNYIIKRDPARAIRRGRQIFQRKFTQAQGQGPRINDGIGGAIGEPDNIATNGGLGAGLTDSCAQCHGLPRGSAGFGGDVVTRPDGRNAPHLFGLGLQEQLADEITKDLRAIRDQAVNEAAASQNNVTRRLTSKRIQFGRITAHPDGTVDTSRVEGVDLDLRVRPFFAQGGTISMREFIVGAFGAEMGMQSPDPCLVTASSGGLCVTPSGMVLDGSKDTIEAPPVTTALEDGDLDGVVNEIDPAIVDFVEFYLLNYFKPGTGYQNRDTRKGLQYMRKIGCTQCHRQNMEIGNDRRVADVNTVFNPKKGHFNRLFATAETKFVAVEDDSNLPPQLLPKGESFLVRNIFTDFKRHDLGPNFHEINYDGTPQTEFVTEPLWGVGSTAPYGHDGRSINLMEVILRHGGEAQRSRDRFARLRSSQRNMIIKFLESLILFPPDSTASNLNPGDPTTVGYPQFGHGSINLGALFQTPGPE